MSGELRRVQRDRHGPQRPAFVCRHTRDSLQTGLPAGLIRLRDDDGNVNGWCEDCQAYLDAHGQEWNDETEAFAGITLMGEACFARVARMNGQGDLD